MPSREPRHFPTPEEIRQRCEKLRAGWTDQEERKRRGILSEDFEYGWYAWNPPTIRLADVILGPRRRG